jgi:GntR family transcriptional repressor for pyruvate dehydrogenase complex
VRSLNADPERLKTMLTRRRRLPEVLEAREAIECVLARLAAQRRTEADLAAIDAAVEAMAADIANGGIGAQADERFHRAIALAAKNKLLSDVMKALEDPIQETRLESLSEPGRPPRSLADHRRIAEAIRGENPRGAETAMRRHLKIVADIRLLRWSPAALDGIDRQPRS